ncbi:hypothetical protein [Pseudomonas fluorescens]|uniref:hypothetical protein n=1 Tax=Pseudomonas fluorescens TaxID=294 RepID=UPI0012421E58|nr:hypothetical protein [Pseudomonas fluorescens]
MTECLTVIGRRDSVWVKNLIRLAFVAAVFAYEMNHHSTLPAVVTQSQHEDAPGELGFDKALSGKTSTAG